MKSASYTNCTNLLNIINKDYIYYNSRVTEPFDF